MRCLTQAQQKGAMMRARGINYRGGYTRDELREKRENEQKEKRDRDENERNYYKNNRFVNRRNKKVVLVVDVFKIRTTNYWEEPNTFIQYINPNGSRKTTLRKDKFNKLYIKVS